MAIWKQVLDPADHETVIPGTPLSVDVLSNEPTVWFDNAGPREVLCRSLTGEDVPEGVRFVGTVVLGGWFVLHYSTKVA